MDVREPVGALGSLVFEHEVARPVEHDVHDHSLAGRKDHRVDELLVLDAAAVTADELHPHARKGDVEHAGVRGVCEVEPYDLPLLRLEVEVRFPGDEQEVAEPSHRCVGRLGSTERGHLAFFDQDVVERQHELAVHPGPVVGIARYDNDVAVEPHLLAVVLADVRVVPVEARVGELHATREVPSDRDRPLRLMRPIGAVLEPQSMPVDGRLQVAVVMHVDLNLGAFGNAQGRPGNRPVVAEHAHGVVSEPLAHRGDPQLERTAVGELDGFARGSVRESGRLSWEDVGHGVPSVGRARSEALHLLPCWPSAGR